MPTMDEFSYIMLALPLLLIDWQIGLLWAVAISSADFVALLLPMEFQGVEVWFVFAAVAGLRIWIFRK